MTRAILIPIHPNWANLIYKGEKTVEVRRRFNPTVEGMTVLFYETRPVGMVTGRAVIARVESATVGDLLDEAMETHTRIPRPDLLKYANGVTQLTAIHLTDAKRFDRPLPLSDLGVGLAPQNYRYIEWEGTIERTYENNHRTPVETAHIARPVP